MNRLRECVNEAVVALAGQSPGEVMTWAENTFSGKVAFASSLGLEDQVMTHMIGESELDIPVFTLDTGRLFPETYDLIAATEKRYGLKIRIYFPEWEAVENMVRVHGVNLFFESVHLRKTCCRIRKVEPLRRALRGSDAWLTGLRRGTTRTTIPVVEWDAINGLVKINPLAEWSDARIRSFIDDNHIPYNPLHDQGFPSIGCASCTRAVEPGEDVRAGRWWWEHSADKECGLHWKDGELVQEKRQ